VIRICHVGLEALLLAGLAYFVGSVVGLLAAEDSYLPKAPPAATHRQGGSAQGGEELPLDIVLRSRLLGQDGGADAASVQAEAEPPLRNSPDADTSVRALPPLRLPYALKGTLAVGDGEGVAVLENTNSRELFTVQPGALLPSGQATVEAVYRREVVFDRGGTREVLLLLPDEAAEGSTAQRTAGAALQDRFQPPDGVVRQTGPNHWILQRQGVQELVDDVSSLLRDMRVVPYAEDGVQGFQIARIKRGSLFDQMGLRRRDVILALNGRPIATPEDAFWMFRHLREESSLQVDLLRGEQRVTFEYEIR
jgi:general secretion pathway protein C